MIDSPPDSITISRFKATCLAVLERVRATGRPIRITRRGELIAEVIPPSPASLGHDWIGSMKGTARIVGDIVSPASPAGEWDVFKEPRSAKKR